MPFDGSLRSREVQIIDLILEVLGPNGERWIKGYETSTEGGHCLMGALKYSRRRLRIRGDETQSHIKRAIGIRYLRGIAVTTFNDSTDDFRIIRHVLLRARWLAAGRPGLEDRARVAGDRACNPAPLAHAANGGVLCEADR